jgi:hypothetical protein
VRVASTTRDTAKSLSLSVICSNTVVTKYFETVDNDATRAGNPEDVRLARRAMGADRPPGDGYRL